MNKLHIVDAEGYKGWVEAQYSAIIPKEHLIPESDTVLVAKTGFIKIQPKGTKLIGYSDVESPEYSPGKLPDGKGGWTDPPKPQDRDTP